MNTINVLTGAIVVNKVPYQVGDLLIKVWGGEVRVFLKYSLGNYLIDAAIADVDFQVAGVSQGVTGEAQVYAFETAYFFENSSGTYIAPPAGDIISPTVEFTALSLGIIQGTFSELMGLVTVAGFSFTDGISIANPSNVVSANGNVYYFTVAGLTDADNLKAAYNSAGGNTKDASGNEVATFTNKTVTNGIPAVVLPTPAAPTVGTGVNNTADTYNFTPTSGYAANLHEYNLKNAGWVTASSATITVGDINATTGDLLIRVKANAGVNNAGVIFTPTIEFTAAAGTPPASNSLVLDETGDWVNASASGTADSYKLYRNTTNDPNTAELIYEGVSPTVEAVGLIAGETNYTWFKAVNGGVDSAFSNVASIVIPDNVDALSLLAIGDSNTADNGANTPPYASRLAIAGYPMNNRGASGSGVQTWIDRYLTWVHLNKQLGKRNIASIMLGTNDAVGQGTTPQAEIDALSPFTERLSEDGFQIVFIAPQAAYTFVSAFEEFAELIMELPSELHVTDAMSIMDIPEIRENNGVDYQNLWYDGLHPNAAGHAYIYPPYKEVMDRVIALWSKRPATPTSPVNSGAGATNAYTVTLPTGYTYLDAEGTTDNGLNWYPCTGSGTTATIQVGNVLREAGYVQIRIKARYVAGLRQYNMHGLGCANVVDFHSTFTETVLPYNDASIVFGGPTAAWNDLAGKAMYEHSNTPGGFVEVPFTKGIRVRKVTDLNHPGGYKFYVDNVEVTPLNAYGTITAPLTDILLDYFSGDNAAHTLRIETDITNVNVGNYYLESGYYLLYQ